VAARLLRSLAYVWASPNTLLGLLLGVLSFQSPRQSPGILIYDEKPRGFIWILAKFKRSAITFGHVVLSNQRVEGTLLSHELHHVWQYERLGPLYIPLYVLVWVFTGYYRHPFEMAAQLAERNSDGALTRER
jgi:hypothetical protein